MSAAPAAPHLEVRGLTKRFGAVVANDGVELTVPRGSIHAVVGENGAGKTTLMRIVCGLDQPDAGHVRVDGQPAGTGSPQAAIALGIGMVHQRFQLIPGLSALENLILGKEPRRGASIDRREARRRGQALAEQLQTQMRWDEPIERLSVGTRQRLEIMRLLYRDAQLLILDEPTTVLTPGEVEDLFAVLRDLAANGRTIVFISHKLAEVLAIADRITVMRRGHAVATLEAGQTNAAKLAGLMVGDPSLVAALEADGEQPRTEHAVSEPRLELEGCTLHAAEGRAVLDVISLQVDAGEIVGVAGVEGNGQRELIDLVLGFREPDEGRVLLGGGDVTGRGVRSRRRAGLAYIPEDRDQEGLDRSGTVRRSAIALRYGRPPIGRAGLIDDGSARRYAAHLIDRYRIIAAGTEAPVRSLSGGNAQRLVVGRELDESRQLLVAAHPSRGVDVKGTAFIHEELLRLRTTGTAILLISEELSELLRLSDRILVLFEGRIVGSFDRGEVEVEQLGRLMTGAEAARPT
jgi:general nucleoside transport system ATP-binding protein